MDKIIIDKMKSHDEECLNLLQQNYSPLIIYILQSFPLSNEDKEECMSDVFIKMWDVKDRYLEDRISLKNYIALITRRVALNCVRKNKYHFSPYEDMDIFGKEDTYEKVEWDTLIHKLSHKEQILFYRKYYYFQSIELISLELGMTYKSVESQLYRLKKKLQKLLKEGGYNG